jgi:hypothetical protein
MDGDHVDDEGKYGSDNGRMDVTKSHDYSKWEGISNWRNDSFAIVKFFSFIVNIRIFHNYGEKLADLCDKFVFF